jgi:hypothetical protein
MHAFLAEDFGGIGVMVNFGLMLAAVPASVLALFALRPAANGNRSSTFKMIAPAVILGLVNAGIWGQGLVRLLSEGHSEMIHDYVRQWVWFCAAPLAMSLLAAIVLWRNYGKNKTEKV